jgi:hypothetical protein
MGLHMDTYLHRSLGYSTTCLVNFFFFVIGCRCLGLFLGEPRTKLLTMKLLCILAFGEVVLVNVSNVYVKSRKRS